LGEAGARPREQARLAGFTSDALSGFDPDDWFQRQMDGGLVTEGKERARMAEKAAEKEARRLDHEHRLAQDKLRTAAKALRREAERKKQAEAQVILDQQRAEAELKREAARAARARQEADRRRETELAAEADAQKRDLEAAERRDAGGKLLSEQERFAVIRRALQAILRSEAFRYVPEAK
jgi:hypothetical protein